MSSRTIGRIYTVAAAFLWGTSFVIVRWGLLYLRAFQFVALRFLVAFFIMFLIVSLNKELKSFSRLLLNKYVVFSSILNAGGYIFQFLGQESTLATNASILVNTSAIFAALFAHYFLRERLNKLGAFSISLAIIGVVLLITGGTLESLFTKYFIGDIFCLLSGIVWGSYIVASKKITYEKHDSRALIAVWFLYTSLIATPFAVLEDPVKLTINAILAVTYLALFCSVLAFLFWYSGLKILEATTSSIYFLLEVLISAVLESIIFGLVLSIVKIIGAIFVIFGIVMTDMSYQIKNRKEIKKQL